MGRSAGRWVREKIGGSRGIFRRGKIIRGGWRAKCCRAVQRKVTGEKEDGWHRPLLGDEPARGRQGESSISGWENGREFGQRRFVSGARRGWLGLARGRGRGGRGVSQPLPLLSSRFFCKRNIKYFVLLCNLPPTLSNDVLDFPLTCQPGRRSMWFFALVLQLFHGWKCCRWGYV